MLLKLCDDYGPPLPETQDARAGYELDAFWAQANLAIEFDGEAVHHTTQAFYSNRVRDRKLRVAGVQVIRITGRDLGPGASSLVADLRRLL